MTYRELRDTAAARLSQAGIEDALSDTYLLMEYFLGMSRTKFLLDGAECVPQEQADHFETVLQRREKREPLQHITGEQIFCDFPFIVNKDVLIPRQDTELLVRLALDQAEAINAVSVLDLCTGSGCIGISIKRAMPQLAVTLSDLSEAALAVAARNVQKSQVQVQICQGDLFAPVADTFDLIVSNPPYIATEEIETLDTEVRLYDPRMALDGAKDGLFFYRRLAEQAAQYLNPGGRILMEIGYDQGKTAAALFEAQGWKEIKVFQDLSGLDRVLMAKKG